MTTKQIVTVLKLQKLFKPVIHNNTQFTQNELIHIEFIGCTVQNNRNVRLFKHPTDNSRIISVGTAFNGRSIHINDNPVSDWQEALEYIHNNLIYVN